MGHEGLSRLFGQNTRGFMLAHIKKASTCQVTILGLSVSLYRKDIQIKKEELGILLSSVFAILCQRLRIIAVQGNALSFPCANLLFFVTSTDLSSC